MFLRTCKDIDKISEFIFDPFTFSSIALIKDRKLIRSTSEEAKNLLKFVLEIVKEAPETELIYFRFNAGDKIFRLVTLKDIAIAIVQEDPHGQSQLYGVEALQLLSNLLISNINLKIIIEKLPLSQLEDRVMNVIRSCIEEAEKAYISMWRKKGLYWFSIENLVSDKGGYTYVFKVRDNRGNIYALKVLKEDLVVNRSFVDIVRGYIHGLTVAMLDEREFNDVLELKGYDKTFMKELILYKKYVLAPRALFVMKDKISKDEYIDYPPAVVEEFASLGDLEHYIELNGVRKFEEAMYIAIRIIGALALTHLLNLVHLDVKPRNILLHADNTEMYGYVPKLNDFSGAIGDSTRGYKFVRLSPGYVDPLALMRGVADFSYDVYSIAAVIAYILSGQIPKHRLALNIIMLQNLYSYPMPMERIGDDEKLLKEFVKKVIDASLQLRSNIISIQTFLDSIREDLDHLDGIYMSWINDIPKSIAEVIRKAFSLTIGTRYQDGINMWLEMKNAFIKEKMDNLIPKIK